MPRKGSHRGGRERWPILPSCLQDGPAGLSPRRPWGINVPSPITDGEHVSGHSPGHPPSGVHCQGETYPCNLPSGYSCSTCTLLRNIMVAPFTWSGSMLPWPTDEIVEASEEPPHQKWKDRMSLKTLERGSARSLLQRLRFSTAG